MGDVTDPDRLEQICQEQAEQSRKSGEENAQKFFERQQRAHRRNGAQQEEPTHLQVPLTEDGIALAFAERHKESLQYDHTRSRWYHWDGARWKVETTQLAFDWARTLCREYNKGNQSNALPKIRTASAVEKFAQSDRRFAVTHEVWDADPWLLCTPGGTVDLRTGKLRNNRREDAITKITAVAPDDIEPCRWLQFLDEVTRGDKALQRFLQQVVGYLLTGDTREHALFFLFGTGGNGKGVFINTLSNIMGDYAVTAGMDTFTASKYDRHPTELAHLCGARLVSASETEGGRVWAESRIKQLTGGDPVAARHMRQDLFEYVPQFKLVFLGNHKPVLINVDEAARRRFHIVPFTHKPETPDKTLSEKLRAEQPSILQWAIDGCLDWQHNGLVVPDAVTRETDAYFDVQDTFTQWLVECTEKKSETTGEPSARLFASWAAWSKKQGEDAGSSKGFSGSVSQCRVPAR
ncbi:MAG: phage/plasmid primase, P4 family [Gammaproteobacteria bacterium]|nr:phage/plasmid primase, P4 family [Gammaproteobacteria bacterium]